MTGSPPSPRLYHRYTGTAPPRARSAPWESGLVTRWNRAEPSAPPYVTSRPVIELIDIAPCEGLLAHPAG